MFCGGLRDADGYPNGHPGKSFFRSDGLASAEVPEGAFSLTFRPAVTEELFGPFDCWMFKRLYTMSAYSFFTSAVQLRTSVRGEGVGSVTSALTRKRCPS